MNESHLAYLSLGSNIQPEVNLVRVVELLSNHGELLKTSSVWETEAVGTDGSNYLNACVLFKSLFTKVELKEQVIHPIEARLGRKRNEDKYGPRTMDIDIILFDDNLIHDHFWELAYVIVPLAEIYPEYQNGVTGEKIYETATRLRRAVWLEVRQGILG